LVTRFTCWAHVDAANRDFATAIGNQISGGSQNKNPHPSNNEELAAVRPKDESFFLAKKGFCPSGSSS
jgi:hypothetical protein